MLSAGIQQKGWKILCQIRHNDPSPSEQMALWNLLSDEIQGRWKVLQLALNINLDSKQCVSQWDALPRPIKMHAQYHFSTFHTVVLIYTSTSRGWQFPQGSWFQHIALISQRQKTYPKHPSLSPPNNEVWVHEKDLFQRHRKMSKNLTEHWEKLT